MKSLLLEDIRTVIEWLFNDYMVINPDKCKYICMGKNSNDNNIRGLNEFSLKNDDEEISLGIAIEQLTGN